MIDIDHWTAHEREHELIAAASSAAIDAHLAEHSIRRDAHAREHALAALAIEKAEQANERRLEGMNAFRTQLDRQAATFVTREAYDAQADRYDVIFRAQAAKHDADVDALQGQIQGEREIRKAFEGSVNTWKWIASFLGVSGVGGVLLLFVTRAHS